MKKKRSEGFLASLDRAVQSVERLGAQAQSAIEGVTRTVETANAKANEALAMVSDAKHVVEVKMGQVQAVSRAAAATVDKARKLVEMPPKTVKVTRTP